MNFFEGHAHPGKITPVSTCIQTNYSYAHYPDTEDRTVKEAALT